MKSARDLITAQPHLLNVNARQTDRNVLAVRTEEDPVRKSGIRKIGGTDISAIVGESRWGGPHAVYRRIVEGYQQPQNPAMRRGQILEPAIRTMFVEATGAQLVDPHPGIVQSEKYDFMTASLDDMATVDGVRRVVEYKSASSRKADEWGAADDDVPPEYLLQCAWYLCATDLQEADLAVLIGGDDFRVYRIKRDLELEGRLVAAAEKFWRDHVLPKRPPPADATSAYGEFLKERYPTSSKPLLLSNPMAEQYAAELRAAKALAAAATEREKAAENALKALIGEAEGIAGSDWKITWKSTKGRTSTDWDAVAAEAKVPRSLIEKHTKLTPYRVFKASL